MTPSERAFVDAGFHAVLPPEDPFRRRQTAGPRPIRASGAFQQTRTLRFGYDWASDAVAYSARGGRTGVCAGATKEEEKSCACLHTSGWSKEGKGSWARRAARGLGPGYCRVASPGASVALSTAVRGQRVFERRVGAREKADERREGNGRPRMFTESARCRARSPQAAREGSSRLARTSDGGRFPGWPAALQPSHLARITRQCRGGEGCLERVGLAGVGFLMCSGRSRVSKRWPERPQAVSGALPTRRGLNIEFCVSL